MFGLSRAAVAVGAVGILAAAIVMGIAGVQTREIRARDRADAAERARVDTARGLAEVHLRLAVLAGGIATQMATAQEAPGASVVGVSAVAFRGPAAPVMGDPDLAAVFWAPHVASADRLAFTREAGPILEESADGHTVRAGDRAEHYPVAHVAPLAGGLRYLGIDLAAPGPIARALAAAVRTREPQLTPPLAGAFGAPGVLLIEPVFGDAGESRGVVVGAIDLPGFGAHALTDLTRRRGDLGRWPPTAAARRSSGAAIPARTAPRPPSTRSGSAGSCRSARRTRAAAGCSRRSRC